MKFHEYLESQYVSTNIANQTKYHPALQAKIMAVQGLLNAQKAVYRFFSYPTLVFQYLLVSARIKTAPLLAAELVEGYKKANTQPQTPAQPQPQPSATAPLTVVSNEQSK